MVAGLSAGSVCAHNPGIGFCRPRVFSCLVPARKNNSAHGFGASVVMCSPNFGTSLNDPRD